MGKKKKKGEHHVAASGEKAKNVPLHDRTGENHQQNLKRETKTNREIKTWKGDRTYLLLDLGGFTDREMQNHHMQMGDLKIVKMRFEHSKERFEGLNGMESAMKREKGLV